MNRSIGIFDSGVGGLTVVKELLRSLPNENILYFGDTARVPYGSKSPQEMLTIVREIINWMAGHDVKAILMACNTSSAVALDIVKKEYRLPLFGLITPTANYISLLGSSVKRIGVIATQATVNSKAYETQIKALRPDIEVFQNACPGLVEVIESGQTSTREAYLLVETFIRPLLENNVDKIILGCTHYPYVASIIEEITNRDDILINPASYMVEEVRQYLAQRSLICSDNLSCEQTYYVSAAPLPFMSVGARLLPGVITSSNVRMTDLALPVRQERFIEVGIPYPAFNEA